MATNEFESLGEQDSSRLPFGFVEKFAFAQNRQKLIDKQDDAENKNESIVKCDLVYGSEKHAYYSMLQIENEIQKCYKHDHAENDNDKNLDELKKEFLTWIKKVEEDVDKRLSSSRIERLISRYWIREFPNLSIENRKNAFEIIDKICHPYCKHTRPHHSQIKNNSSNNTNSEYPCTISRDKIISQCFDEMKREFDKCLHQENRNVSDYFGVLGLEWFLEQCNGDINGTFDSCNKLNDVLNCFSNLRLVKDSNILVDCVSKQIEGSLLTDENKDKNEKDSIVKFGEHKLHNQLTILEMNKLSDKHPQLWKCHAFLDKYMTKLMPSKLLRYRNKEWSLVPNKLRFEFLSKLYKWIIESINSNSKLNDPFHSTIKAFILWKYIYFIWKNYGDYEIEAILEYIRIPKQSHWNDELMIDWQKNDPNFYNSSHLCDYNRKYSAFEHFNKNDEWSLQHDQEFLESFFIHLFSNSQMWIEIQNGNYKSKYSHNGVSSKFSSKWLEKNGTSSSSIVDAFKEFIDEERLKEMEALGGLYSGNVNNVHQHCKYLRSLYDDSFVNELRDERLIEFVQGKNKRHFSLADNKVTILVNVKNIESLNVKVFEINTKSYYRKKKQAIESNLNLNGFNPIEEWTIDSNNLGLKNNYHKKCIEIDLPDNFIGKRGIYFIDLIGSGIESRCIIQIGNIFHVENITEAGHEFTLYDENRKQIQNCNIWMSGHSYKSDTFGKIVIPFTTSSSTECRETILLERDDDSSFNVLSSFYHQSEEYKFKCSFYMDREQILHKNKGKLFLKSQLKLNGKNVSLKLCENVKLVVKISRLNGVDSLKTFNNVKLDDFKETIVSFTLPMEVTRVAVTIGCDIVSMTENKELKFSDSDSFAVNGINKKLKICQLFVIPLPNNEYIVTLCGKNGEAIPGAKLNVQLHHELLKYCHGEKNKAQFDMRTDENGRIYLPCMNDFSNFEVSSTEYGLSQHVDLTRGFQHCHTPTQVQMTASSVITMPYYVACGDLKNFHFGLFDATFSQTFNTREYIEYNSECGYFTIGNLPVGIYLLLFQDLRSTKIVVAENNSATKNNQKMRATSATPPKTTREDEKKENENENDNDVTGGATVSVPPNVTSAHVSGGYNNIITDSNEYFELSNIHHLNIESISGNRECGIKISLRGHSDVTRVHLIGTHFLPSFDIVQCLLTNINNPQSKLLSSNNDSCLYLKQRLLGDEYRYVLEREKSVKFVGNSLETPSLFVKPFEHGGTKTTRQITEEVKSRETVPFFSDEVAGAINSFPSMYEGAVSPGSGRYPIDDKTIDFLANASVVVVNLECPNDGNGEIYIDASVFDDNHQFLRVIAMDDKDFVMKSFVFEPANFTPRDKSKNDDNDSAIVSVGGKAAGGDDEKHADILFNYSDNRLFPGLNPLKSFLDEKTILLLNGSSRNNNNNNLVIEDYKTSDIETYETLNGVFRLLLSLCENSSKYNECDELKNKWSFLTTWNNLSQAKKLLKYNSFMCHELNFFLFKKDFGFFKTVCIPLIESKLHKTFLDYYLLGDYTILISNYIGTHNQIKYNQLNIFEKILLHSIVGNVTHTSFTKNNFNKYLYDKCESIKMDESEFDKLFEIGLATKSMDDDKPNKRKPQPPKKAQEQKQQEEKEELDRDDGGAWLNSLHSYARSSLAEDFEFESDDEVLVEFKTKKELHRHTNERYKAPSKISFVASGFSQLMRKASSARQPVEYMRKQNLDAGAERALQKRKEIMSESQLFKQVKSTKEYQETYYYNTPFETNTSNLIEENQFWCDFGNFMLNKKEKDTFISSNILVPTNNINEILIVLAVLDVPFESDGPSFTYDNNSGNISSRVVIEAETPTIVFAKQLKPFGETRGINSGNASGRDSNSNKKKKSISIHVHYFDANDRFTIDKNGDKCEKFVYKFVPVKIYTCQVVLTNFSSIKQNIQLLSQIPSGSIPVNTGFVTKTSFHTLNSYSTTNFQFSFYFPTIGTFKHYPFTISQNGQIIGDANIIPKEMVVQYPPQNEILNVLSWKDVSQNANLKQLKEYFLNGSINNNVNIFTIDWSLIYHRLTNASIFEFIFNFLNDKNMFNVDIWNYSFYHLKCVTQLQQQQQQGQTHETKTDSEQYVINRETYLQDLSCDLASFEKLLFIAMGQLIGTNNNMQTRLLSPIFTSNQAQQKKLHGWINYDDIDFGNYTHLEYMPYVNARRHLLGNQREIVNNAFKLQYGKILDRIINNSTNVHDIVIEDKLSLLYYLLLQDRIDHALDLYSIVKFDKHNLALENSFTIDYLSIYMSLYRDSDVANAIKIGNNMVSKYGAAKLSLDKAKLLKDVQVLLQDLNNVNNNSSELKREEQEDNYNFVEQDFGRDRNRNMSKMSDKSSSLDFEIVSENRELLIHYANISSLIVNFYTMNTEVLFSKRPFLGDRDNDNNNSSNNNDENEMFSYISPNEQIVIDSQSIINDNVINKYRLSIPESLKNCNVFIQVLSDRLSVEKAFYDNELIVQLKENYGQLKVYYRKQRQGNINSFLTKPLSKAYVKVYAMTRGGNHEFYKVE